ncbi:MAG: cobalamin-dependent protein [Planctomycetota bacterium]
MHAAFGKPVLTQPDFEPERWIERLFEVLINGDRRGAQAVIEDALEIGLSPADLVAELFWPAYENLDKLYRKDQLTKLCYHLGTRLLRVLVDQNAARLEATGDAHRKVFAVCGPTDADELGAQMAVDLLESNGFAMTYAGGSIPNDEVLAQLHEDQPDVLLMFASAPSDLPSIRQLIDTIREIGACDKIQIVVGGGVFNRAEGLAEEIGADLWASDPLELVDVMVHEPERRAEVNQRTVGRKRVRKAA